MFQRTSLDRRTRAQLWLDFLTSFYPYPYPYPRPLLTLTSPFLLRFYAISPRLYLASTLFSFFLSICFEIFTGGSLPLLARACLVQHTGSSLRSRSCADEIMDTRVMTERPCLSAFYARDGFTNISLLLFFSLPRALSLSYFLN